MFSKMPPWIKSVLNEFTKPPSFFHHNHSQNQSQASSQQTPQADSSAGQSISEKKATNKTNPIRKPIDDEFSSPTDPPPKPKSARNTKSSSKSNGYRNATSSEPKPNGFRSLHPNYDMRVLESYPFNVQDAEVYNEIIKIETGKDAFLAFKATNLTTEKVNFIYRALQYVKHKGFRRYSQFVLTKQGRPYVKDGVRTYYVTRWVDGAPVDLSQLSQLGKTAETLARFHEASIGFETMGRHPRMAFDLYQRYLERSQQMMSFIHLLQAKSKPTAADELFIKHAATFQQQASRALTLFKQPEVLKHLDREEDMPGLCHLDVVERNVIFHPTKQVHLIDFDHMTYAPRALDLAHLIRRGMQKTDWSSQVALVSLINYNGIRPLSHAEYLILEALLTYPHRWWRLLQMYANSPNQAIVPLVENMLGQEDNRQKFLRSFDRQVTRQKTVS